MLFTRCPDCDTTFRVTDDALKKANGQVRCGRCASVFNAYAELQRPEDNPALEPQPQSEPTEPEPAHVELSEPPPPDVAAPSAEEPVPTDDPSLAVPSPAVELERPASVATRPSDPLGALVADVVAQVERGGADDGADTGELEAGTWDEPATISAAQVDAVLDIKEPEAPVMPPDWTLPAGARRHSRWWSAAAAIAVLALGVQLLHHYRATLAGQAFVGPILQEAYGMLGSTVTPRWDIRQYHILDWVAAAEPNSGGQGNLRITARIQNAGPRPQPYPSVHLRLKDRFEAAVGSRVFTPAQYLEPTLPIGRMMTAGETTRAQLDVVDPGPDAYGFELDVCIEVEADVLSCGTDKVFQ